MANDGISVPYNCDLEPLETLLAGVRRTGDFFVHGSLETPMPRVEVEGIGVISFPVPEAQVQQLIQQATRAPYGRGEETIVDESVRKVWQLPANRVRVGGKTWEKTLEQILARIGEGLGCADRNVSAELYKLLVYDPGGFFAAHRDTEKAGGMFGTLVVVLPSAHRGGALVIRHAGREIVVELSTDEYSEMTFVAFYADCEHEVRPITEGHRVCLIYNLIQAADGKTGRRLSAPDYEEQIAGAAGLLENCFGLAAQTAGSAGLQDAQSAAAAAAPLGTRHADLEIGDQAGVETRATPGAPAKLAWLLEHKYSPAGLSFAGLKGEDAARVKVLRAAAERAGCAIHLGIVHIEETGSAEPDYNPGHGYGRRGRWHEDEDEETEEDASVASFDVIEVSDRSEHIDQWVNTQDQPVAFGRLPLEEGELLPAGALDNEAPDEQRLMEATGNEGASFERSYHRAALVIWPRERFAAVLLQAGVGAALPHLNERIAADDPAAAGIARQIVETWEQPPTGWSHRSTAAESNRAEMLRLLTQLGDRALLKRFVSGVVTREFDGSETEALAKAFAFLGPKESAKRLATLARENMPLFHCACVDLVSRLSDELDEALNDAWRAALHEAAAVMVPALLLPRPTTDGFVGADWQRRQKVKPVDAALVADLLDFLRVINADALRLDAAARFVEGVAVFDPGKVIVPALTILQQRARAGMNSDAAAGRLWVHAAEFLLARSEHPPAPPTDWRQAVTIECKCEDCRGLQSFALDAGAQEARFRVRQDRRQHLQRQIHEHGLDMTHVTDRTGSPQTLVCTKTRRTFQRQCEQHRADCASMNALLDALRPAPAALAGFTVRLTAAKERKPQKPAAS